MAKKTERSEPDNAEPTDGKDRREAPRISLFGCRLELKTRNVKSVSGRHSVSNISTTGLLFKVPAPGRRFGLFSASAPFEVDDLVTFELKMPPHFSPIEVGARVSRVEELEGELAIGLEFSPEYTPEASQVAIERTLAEPIRNSQRIRRIEAERERHSARLKAKRKASRSVKVAEVRESIEKAARDDADKVAAQVANAGDEDSELELMPLDAAAARRKALEAEQKSRKSAVDERAPTKAAKRPIVDARDAEDFDGESSILTLDELSEDSELEVKKPERKSQDKRSKTASKRRASGRVKAVKSDKSKALGRKSSRKVKAVKSDKSKALGRKSSRKVKAVKPAPVDSDSRLDLIPDEPEARKTPARKARPELGSGVTVTPTSQIRTDAIPAQLAQPADSARAEKAKAEKAKAEKARAEKAKAEKARAEKAKAEKARAEKAKAEKARAEKAKAEKARAEKAKAEKARAEKAKAEKARAEKAKAEKARAEKAKAEKARAEKAKAEKEALEERRAALEEKKRRLAELKKRKAELAQRKAELAKRKAESQRRRKIELDKKESRRRDTARELAEQAAREVKRKRREESERRRAEAAEAEREAAARALAEQEASAMALADAVAEARRYEARLRESETARKRSEADRSSLRRSTSRSIAQVETDEDSSLQRVPAVILPDEESQGSLSESEIPVARPIILPDEESDIPVAETLSPKQVSERRRRSGATTSVIRSRRMRVQRGIDDRKARELRRESRRLRRASGRLTVSSGAA